jgi:hypothetical protein
MFLPHAAALSAILTSFPHLLSYGLPAYPPPSSAGGLPPGYPAYPGYPPYPYPYPYPAPDQPQPSAEAAAAAAAAMAHLPIDPALLAQLAANNPMAFVKRELRDEEQHVKEVEVQEHAMALDSARRRRDRDERDEASGGGRTPSPRTGRRHRARQESDDDSPSSESAEEPTRSKRQRRTTKPRN